MLLQLLPFLPYLLCAGAVAGVLAGLFGIGGGAILVPTLFTLLCALQVPTTDAMAMALATSLACIVPTAAVSSFSHFQKGHVLIAIIWRWWPGILVGTVLGSIVVNQWRSPFLMVYFAGFLLLVAFNQLRTPKTQKRELPATPWHLLAGLFQGFLSVLAGVGGGTIAVPILTAMGVKIHEAIGTSALLGLFIAVFTSLVMLATSHTPALAPVGAIGLIYVPAFLIVTPLSSLFAPLGVMVNKRLPGKWLSRLFALFLILIAGRMGYLAFAV